MEKQDSAEINQMEQGGGNMLRTAAYGCVILFFGLLSVTIVIFLLGLNRTRESVVEPFSNLVQNLAVPVTPAIVPNASTIVKEINDLARLETASFEFEKIVTAESNQEILWGAMGESMIFVGYGKVYAGVDFQEMSPEDLVVIDPTTVEVHLPPAKIFEDIPVLDNERSFVADRDTGIFASADPELETQVRQAAEASIREAAQESDILERANANAEQYMVNFLQGVGFENVIFVENRPEPRAPWQQEVPKGFVLPGATAEATPTPISLQ